MSLLSLFRLLFYFIYSYSHNFPLFCSFICIQSQKIHELTAYLQLERAERAKLEVLLSEQKATIHQLSHHIQILRSQAQAQATSSMYELDSSDRFTTSGGIGTTANSNNIVPEYTHTYSTATSIKHAQDNTHSLAHNYRKEHTSDAHSVHNDTMHDTHSHLHAPYPSSHPPFSQTVPLTPMSVKGPLHRTFTPGTAHSVIHAHHNHHKSDTSYTATGALPYATNYEAQQLRDSNNHINIIRASIPPAPWENA